MEFARYWEDRAHYTIAGISPTTRLAWDNLPAAGFYPASSVSSLRIVSTLCPL